MANGIDSIYDPSDVSRMLIELREERLAMEEARRRKIEATARVGSSAWKMWSGEQAAKTKELLDTKDYVIDPKYTEKNWLSRSFTPASKRVMPAPDRAISLDKYKSLTGQGGIKERISPVRRTKRITEMVDPMGDVDLSVSRELEDAPDIMMKSPQLKGGDPITTKEVAAGAETGVPAKLGLKEAGAGIGAGMSLYETISSWDEHKKNKGIKRGVDVGKTLAYTASAVPGPHQAITAPIAGILTLADLFI